MRAARYINALLLITAISFPAYAQRGQKNQRSNAPQPPPQQQQQNRGNSQQVPPGSNQPSQAERLHGPGPHNGDWLRRFGNMPEQDQRRELQNDPNFQKLPKERQQRLMQRLDNYNRMTPEQKQHVLDRMETLEHMTPEQRTRTRELFQQFRGFDPDSRQRVTGALRRLRGMPPDARQNFYNSDAFRSNYNSQEQNVIKGLAELGPTDAEPPENPDK